MEEHQRLLSGLCFPLPIGPRSEVGRCEEAGHITTDLSHHLPRPALSDQWDFLQHLQIGNLIIPEVQVMQMTGQKEPLGGANPLWTISLGA